MHTEFGTGGFDDDSQPPSERTSLASWGRNLLMEQISENLVPVLPSDSLSTRGPQPSEIRVPICPKTLPITEVNEEDNIKIEQNAPNESSQKNPAPTSSPPPKHPPPPLPEAIEGEAIRKNIKMQEATSNQPIPPPLPPRKSLGIHSHHLPDATVDEEPPLKSR